MSTSLPNIHLRCSSSSRREERSAGDKLLELKRTENVGSRHRAATNVRSPYGSRGGPKSSKDQVLVKTDGYTLSRSASRVRMNIQTDAFFGEAGDQVHRRSTSAVSGGSSTPTNIMDQVSSKASNRSDSSIRDRELQEMKQAYENLQLELEEFKFSRDTERDEMQAHIAMLEEKLELEGQELIAAHEEEMENTKCQHSTLVAEMEEKHAIEVQSMFSTLKAEKAKFEKEIELLEKSLKTMRDQMTQEKEEQLNDKDKEIEEMKKEHRNALIAMEEKMRESCSTEMIHMQDKMGERHKREMEVIKEEHKNEVEELTRQLSRIEQLENDATRSGKIIKKLEKKNIKLKQEIKSYESQQIAFQAKLLETETALEAFKKGFESKVRDVESKLKDRLDNLVLENSQLRKKLLTKTEEFCQFKVNVERSNARTLQSFKERVQVLLNARNRAKLGMALGIFEDSSMSHEEFLRPVSAPSTEKEVEVMRQSLLATEETLKQQTTPHSQLSPRK